MNKKELANFIVNLKADTEDLMETLESIAPVEPIKLKQVSPTVKLPSYGTKRSARFDLRVALDHKQTVLAYDKANTERRLEVVENKVSIPPGFRGLFPTGFIFGIPEGYELTIVPRSSTALKRGLFKANSVAIIDEDFRDETHLMLFNASDFPLWISHNDRLGQGKLQRVNRETFEVVDELPEIDSDRIGGWGSTGEN